MSNILNVFSIFLYGNLFVNDIKLGKPWVIELYAAVMKRNLCYTYFLDAVVFMYHSYVENKKDQCIQFRFIFISFLWPA